MNAFLFYKASFFHIILSFCFCNFIKICKKKSVLQYTAVINESNSFLSFANVIRNNKKVKIINILRKKYGKNCLSHIALLFTCVGARKRFQKIQQNKATKIFTNITNTFWKICQNKANQSLRKVLCL